MASFTVTETTMEAVADGLEDGSVTIVSEHDFGFASVNELAMDGKNRLVISSPNSDKLILIAAS